MMRGIIRSAILGLLGTVLSGCASPRAYFIDRGRDMADIVTLTVATSAGVRTRVGPLHAGLYLGADKAGLRAGQFRTTFDPSHKGDIADVEATVIYAESFRDATMDIADARNKFIEGRGGPLVCAGGCSSREKVWQQNLPFYTQIDLAAGVGAGIKVGFNPGELMDFVLGWMGIDIFCDDIGQVD